MVERPLEIVAEAVALVGIVAVGAGQAPGIVDDVEPRHLPDGGDEVGCRRAVEQVDASDGRLICDADPAPGIRGRRDDPGDGGAVRARVRSNRLTGDSNVEPGIVVGRISG